MKQLQELSYFKFSFKLRLSKCLLSCNTAPRIGQNTDSYQIVEKFKFEFENRTLLLNS